MKIKEFLIKFLYGGFCVYLGMSFAGLISFFTGFNNKYFMVVFGSLFGVLFIFKFQKIALKFFNIK
jgi:hypothetical protein